METVTFNGVVGTKTYLEFIQKSKENEGGQTKVLQ